eukprot:Gregarina_sp_Poly_1__10212@NODE_708_length_6677_cov_81_679879_g535_i0_p2_GENE_NODE_708_length_6677_cov_81_679879_g535_i0NODE_708_length_6677_cov_81_679879_g535_i0_p2_ORF_typecomplete_len500_score73_29Pkinase_Tyr/PF07714_17/0_0067Proteasom_PSMB/PF10508_9/0_036VATPase_H_N/PF03224_14/0_2VATPase_H_N/PF03224_14/7_7e02_NODE_708_length_6677_cov_81_679879_g535_i044805979
MAYTKTLVASSYDTTCEQAFSGPRGLPNGSTAAIDPPLSYTAPEASRIPTGRCSVLSDVFSLALVALECLSCAVDVGPTHLVGSWNPPAISSKARHQTEMAEFLRKLKSRTSPLPAPVYHMLLTMLDETCQCRPYLDTFETSVDFNNVSLRAMKFCDSFAEKDDVQKSEFLKAFYPLMIKNSDLQSPEILRSRILPPLMSSLSLKFISLLPSVLKSVLWILTKLSDPNVLMVTAWPHLQPLLTANEIQIESVVLLLDHLGLLVSLSPQDIQTHYWVPFMLKCLTIQNNEIQKTVLQQLPMLFKHSRDGTLKTNVLPKLLDLISHEQCTPKLRCDGVKTLAEVSEYLDRASVIQFILPAVHQISTIDRTGETTAALFELLDSLKFQMGIEMTVSHLMAVALPLLTNPLLDSQAYFKCYSIVEEALTKFHKAKSKEHEQKRESQGVVSSVLNLQAAPTRIQVRDDTENAGRASMNFCFSYVLLRIPFRGAPCTASDKRQSE